MKKKKGGDASRRIFNISKEKSHRFTPKLVAHCSQLNALY
jgi:hypothetical protein